MKLIKHLLLALLPALVTTMSACDDDNKNNGFVDYGPAGRIDLSRAETDATAGINDFGWDALDAIGSIANGAESNTVVSPLGLSMVLSMAANGADESTQQEILHTILGESGTIGTINLLNAKLMDQLPMVQQASTFIIKNSVWTIDQTNLLDDYGKSMAQIYQAEIAHIDDRSQAVATINSWVSDKTKGCISKYLSDDMRFNFMALNVLYMKGLWKTPFDKSATRSEAFYDADGEPHDVQMMHGNIYMPYYEDEKMQVCDMSYKQDAFAMAVILPKAGVSMQDIISTSLIGGSWQADLQQAYVAEVKLSMPKLRVEFAESADNWKTAMRSLGINSLFDAGLSNVTNDNLVDMKLLQKCIVEIDEEGMKAAAATSVDGTSESVGPIMKTEMTVNRPFIFAIYERSTGVLLFVGRINKA